MRHFIAAIALSSILLAASGAQADGPAPAPEAPSLQERIRQTWDDARSARDAMVDLRHDGGLGTEAGQAELAALRAEVEACRIQIEALGMERKEIAAARRARVPADALASRN